MNDLQGCCCSNLLLLFYDCCCRLCRYCRILLVCHWNQKVKLKEHTNYGVNLYICITGFFSQFYTNNWCTLHLWAKQISFCMYPEAIMVIFVPLSLLNFTEMKLQITNEIHFICIRICSLLLENTDAHIHTERDADTHVNTAMEQLVWNWFFCCIICINFVVIFIAMRWFLKSFFGCVCVWCYVFVTSKFSIVLLSLFGNQNLF